MGGLLGVTKHTQILSWFGDIAEDVGNWLLDWVSNIVGGILWLFCEIFFVILDLFETIFRKFAGIDTNVTTASGEKIEGDLVLYFISSDLIQDIFISILILSVILLIIFTIFAIIKNQYAEKQEPVKKIIGNSFKGLWLYMLIPVATIVCLVVGNVVLQAIDGATKLNSAGGASDMLFSTATYNANRLRAGTKDEKIDQLSDMDRDKRLPEGVRNWMEQACPGLDISDPDTYGAADWNLLADILDEAFVQYGIGGETDKGASDTDGLWGFSYEMGDKWNFSFVNNYYYALKISYITIWVGGAFLIWAIGKIAWGMVARLFKMVIYFAISPAVVATYPIKGDGPLKGWTGEMVKNGTSAYCAVGVMNVLYSVLPFFNNIDMFGDSVNGQGWTTAIARLFIYIIAFSSAQNLVSTVSGWFGTGDAIKDGKEAKGQVTAGLTKGVNYVGGAFAGFKGGRDAANVKYGGKSFKDRAMRTFGGLSGAFTGSGLKDSMIGDYEKAFKGLKDKEKSGKEAGKDFVTFGWTPTRTELNKTAYEALEEGKKMKAKYEKLHGKGTFDSADITNPVDRTRIINATAPITNEYFADELAQQQRNKTLLDKLEHGRKLTTKASEKTGEYEAEMAKVLGLSSYADLEGIVGDEATRNKILEAVLAGNTDKINAIASSTTDTSVIEMLSGALENMTDQQVATLNMLKDGMTEAIRETSEAEQDLMKEISENGDLSEVAEGYGMIKDGSFVGFEEMLKIDATTGKALYTEAAEGFKAAADKLSNDMAGFGERLMKGTSNTSELEKLAKILNKKE